MCLNTPPTLTAPIADQSTNEDSSFSFTLPANTFTDANSGDTLTYAATLASDSPLPAWLGFDAATQTFSGTPLNGDVGAIDVKVTATDSSGAAASDVFALTVLNTNDAPTVAQPLADQNATEGAAFSYVVPSSTFADVDAGDTLTYAAKLARWLGAAVLAELRSGHARLQRHAGHWRHRQPGHSRDGHR